MSEISKESWIRFGMVVGILSTLLSSVSADLPVSCLRTQLHDQTWLFHVTPEPEDVDLFR